MTLGMSNFLFSSGDLSRAAFITTDTFEKPVAGNSVGTRKIAICTIDEETKTYPVHVYTWASSAWNDLTPDTWRKIGQTKDLMARFRHRADALKCLAVVEKESINSGFVRAPYMPNDPVPHHFSRVVAPL